jgi:aminopeptidase-like protein
VQLAELRAALDGPEPGERLHSFVAALFPITRSITGAGVRETLERVGARIPLEVHEVPSGTEVLDWTVPPEWELREAWIADGGRRVVDVKDSNLHLVSYSAPVHARMTLAELRGHLYSLPDRPEWIPYRTSYYRRDWGFCVAHRQLESMPEGEYEVCIDTTLREDGALTYGECVLPGATDETVLISTHVCHPSLANDNCTGIAVATELASLLGGIARRFTYRFVFVPGTIGSIAWLAANEPHLSTIAHGLVLTGLGDAGPLTYKRSRRGRAPIDRAVEHVLAASGAEHRVVDFSPYGYDERQYCSPGFDLPVGRLTRTPHGEYPEYHTSADDLSFVAPVPLGDALRALVDVLVVLEGDTTYRNTHPKGEPQLGRRGLYRAIGGDVDPRSAEMALLWVLNLSDGAHSLLDVVDRSGLPFTAVRAAADRLLDHGLLEPV